MKFLLTSAGLTNKSIVNELIKLLGKPLADSSLAFVPTAANVEDGDKGWLIKDLSNCQKAGFKEVDIVDFSALPKDVWLPRMKNAHVLLFGGGNTFHLMDQIRKQGVDKELATLLIDKLYIGISAGSMVVSTNLELSSSARLYSESVGEITDDFGLGYVNFQIRPHLNSGWFPNLRLNILEKHVQEIKGSFYAIDDQTAISVTGSEVQVISEGEWRKFN
jgi:dipeptidase E